MFTASPVNAGPAAAYCSVSVGYFCFFAYELRCQYVVNGTAKS